MSSTDYSDLPDEVLDAIAPHLAETPDLLDAIGVAIAERRDDAKAARTASGIEEVWRECEEAYVGIDDANRMEFNNARWSKPMSPDGPVTTGRTPRQTDHKSTAFVRLTARYVDAGAAKLAEILLPPDDKAFSFSEMPVPELTAAAKDTSQVVHDGIGNVPLTRPAKPGEAVPPQAAPAPAIPAATPAVPAAPTSAPASALPTAPVPVAAPAPRVPLTVKDLAEEHIEIARKAAEAAETRVYDWLLECQYPAEMRKVIFDAARIGVGVLKGPYPKPSRVMAMTTKPEALQLEIREEIKPAAKWIDPWNVFPDPACGENIHEGDYVFERDHLSAKQLRALKDVPGYLASQIDAVLAEGPLTPVMAGDDAPSEPAHAERRERRSRYEVWYYYGVLTRDEMACVCRAAGREQPSGNAEQVAAIVTLVNRTVIRATVNPLDSGSFPYHSVPWQRRAGHWAGIGVAEQIKVPQKIVTAATRALLNNAGKSAGSQIVVDQGAIKPADGSWTIVPDKIWYKSGDSVGQDVRQSFMAIEVPNVTAPLMQVIEYGMQLAEESTSIPLITQGQSGETTPDTYGAAQLQNNNANQLLRSIGYSFDDYITEPVVRQFYEWLLLDPEVPDEEKGEFRVNAHGSAALVERAIQDQAIAQMGNMALNPVYGIDPKKWFEELARSKHLDPRRLQYTEEQQQKIAETPPPPSPPVQVAQINAQVAREQIAAKQSTDQRSAANEQQIAQAAQDLDGRKTDIEHQRVAVDATVRLHEIQARRETALLEYANRHQISLDKAKADLAKTAMTLNVQQRLNATDNAADARKTRPARSARPQRSTSPLAPVPDQVPGRAGNGRAFEQAP